MLLDLEFFNILEKERQYKDYLMAHIAGVEEAYNRLILPLKGKYDKETDDAIDLCGQYVMLHDLSKLSKYEFEAYRKHFYPTDKEKKLKSSDESEYELAWEHHHQNNPHHPIHWVKDGKKQDMPLNFIFEMLCDWDSVSQWYKTSLIDWYDNKATDEKASFSDNTRKTVDFWFDEIFRKPGLEF